jgi:hypothetical protein
MNEAGVFSNTENEAPTVRNASPKTGESR